MVAKKTKPTTPKAEPTEPAKAMQALGELRAELALLALLRRPGPTPISAYVEEMGKRVDLSRVVIDAGEVKLAGVVMSADALGRARGHLEEIERIEKEHALAEKKLQLIFVRNNYQNEYEDHESEGDNRVTIDGEVFLARMDDLKRYVSFSARGEIVINVRSGYGGIRSVERKDVAFCFNGEPLWPNFDDVKVHGESPAAVLSKQALGDVVAVMCELAAPEKKQETEWAIELLRELVVFFAPRATPDEDSGR